MPQTLEIMMVSNTKTDNSLALTSSATDRAVVDATAFWMMGTKCRIPAGVIFNESKIGSRGIGKITTYTTVTTPAVETNH